METTLIKIEDIVIKFAEATKRKDLDNLKNLLSDDGEFQIQNSKFESVNVGKEEFLTWFKVKLEETEIEEIKYDQCINCSFGKPVIILNGGEFPRRIKDVTEPSKTGYMVETRDGKISILKFCFVFLKTENKCQLECNTEKIKTLLKQGLSFNEAYNELDWGDDSDSDFQSGSFVIGAKFNKP